MSIRVVLAEDQEMVRTGFAMILSNCSGIEVVGRCRRAEASGCPGAQRRGKAGRSDRGRPPIAVTRRVSGQTSVVIVTTFGDDEYVDQALAAGACGFLLKDSGPGLLVAGVRAAATGDALISPELTIPLLRRTRGRTPVATLEGLSPRQIEVALTLASRRG